MILRNTLTATTTNLYRYKLLPENLLFTRII